MEMLLCLCGGEFNAEGRTPALNATVLMRAQYGLAGQIGGSPPDVTPWTALGWDGWEIVVPYALRGQGTPPTSGAPGGKTAAAAGGAFIGYGMTVTRSMDSDGGGGDSGGDFGGFDF